MLRLVRNLFGVGLLLSFLTVVAGILAGTLFLQERPALEIPQPPEGSDVAATRALIRDIRTAATEADGLLNTDVDQINSALKLGGRFLPGFRGEVQSHSLYVSGHTSIPVPWLDGRRWLNVTGQIPEFSNQFTLSEVTIGEYNVPPRLALSILRIGINIAGGDAMGDTAVQAVQGLQIEHNTLIVRLRLDEMGKNGLMRGAFGALKGGSLPSASEIEAFHVLIRTAMEDGRLSQTGSFLPYLQFVLQAARNGSAPATLEGRYSAAILGLAKACGAQDFSLIVGRLVFALTSDRDWSTNCEYVTLNGRQDSRRHFLTSAALQAISNTGFAVSAGEFKELYDTVSGAGGFDFTDMTANLSGIRMSNTLMATPAEDWPNLMERLDSERAVIPEFDGIPQIMPEADFEAEFGDIDSALYLEMIALIEARIDNLRLHEIR